MTANDPAPIVATIVVETGPRWVATVVDGKRHLYRDVRAALQAALKSLEEKTT